MKKGAHKNFFILIAYAATHIINAIFNRIVMAKFFFNFPLFISILQYGILLLFIEIASSKNIINLQPYTLERGKELMIPSILYSLSTYFTLISLDGVSLHMFPLMTKLAPLAAIGIIFFLSEDRDTLTVGKIGIVGLIVLFSSMSVYFFYSFQPMSWFYGLFVAISLPYSFRLYYLQAEKSNIIDVIYVNCFNCFGLFMIADLVVVNYIVINVINFICESFKFFFNDWCINKFNAIYNYSQLYIHKKNQINVIIIISIRLSLTGFLFNVIMISHSKATKPPSRLNNTKLTTDHVDFNLHDVDSSFEITNNSESFFKKRRSSRLIEQSMDIEKNLNKTNDITFTKKDYLSSTTSLPKIFNKEIEHYSSENDSLHDEEGVDEKLNIVETISNNEINDQHYDNEINLPFRSGRRKQIFDLDDNNIDKSQKNKKHFNNIPNERISNKNTNCNEVFGSIQRLFPKTIDPKPNNFKSIFDTTPNFQSNTYKYSLNMGENTVHSTLTPCLQKQKPPVNYLTEQALASIANNEKANANKVKHRTSRLNMKPPISKIIDDNEIRNDMPVEPPIFSSFETVKKSLPKVNVIVSKATHSNSGPQKLIEQKKFLNVTNNFKNNSFTTIKLNDEKNSQTISTLSKHSNTCHENATSFNQPKIKTVQLKTIDVNLQKVSSNMEAVKNTISSNQACRVLVKNEPNEELLPKMEQQSTSKNLQNQSITNSNNSQEKIIKSLTPTSGRVVVIKSSGINKQNNLANNDDCRNTKTNILTVPFQSEPGPSGLQSIKTNQSFNSNTINNKPLQYNNRTNLKRKNFSSESNNSSQGSSADFNSIERPLSTDRSPILLKGIKTKIPLNKLREIAMKCFIPRSITANSLIYKRSRRSFNFTSNKNGKLVMLCTSGKNVISKGPIENDILSKMKEVPILKQYASTESSDIESNLYQTVIVCAYFTSFYSVKMFKIVKRREYYPRSCEALPFYPTKEEIDEETATVPKRRKRSKSCEFPISYANDYLVVYIPVKCLKKYGILNNEEKNNDERELINSPYTPEQKVCISQKIYDSKTKHLYDDNYSDDMEGELKGVTVSVEVPPPRNKIKKEIFSETSLYNSLNVTLPENRTLPNYNTKMIRKGLESVNECDMTISSNLNKLCNNKNDLENNINHYNESSEISSKKTIRTIYTHPNKIIKETRTTYIPTSSKRFYSNRDIPDDALKILDYFKLKKEPTIYTEENIESIRNFGRKMTASYQYLHRIKDMELWNIVDEVINEIKRTEKNIENEKVPGDNQSNLIQTIKGQVLKRGRGRPRKSETEKTVLEEEIIKRSDDGMADIKEIDEECLLSTEDMLIERENNGYNIDQFLYKDDKDDETILALASIDSELPSDKINNDILKRKINNSYGYILDPMTKDDNDIFSFRESSISNDDYNERRKIIGHSIDGKECYTAIPKEDYPLYKGRCSTLTLVDEMLHKNSSEIGLGVKYHTLKEMEINEYDKVRKTEEAIYGPRPNAYTKFIEENKEMFMNDCSLRYVFDEMGRIRKFPLYGDDNNLSRYNFNKDETIFYDNDSLDDEIRVKSFDRYNNMYEQMNLYDEDEDESLQTDEDDEEELEDEEEDDNNIYSNSLNKSKQSTINNYQNKMSLQHRYLQNLNSTMKKQRKQRISKPRGPYMTKKRRIEALKASQGIGNTYDDHQKTKRPVGRPRGSTKRKANSSTPVDPATISLNNVSISKKTRSEETYYRPTFNSILAASKSPTEYSKTK
uniref:Sugar phosphate transporter domain-containing protein n=1 Tax=Strongyloides stercoralis TaxID=6248 RepID=A0AAF5DK70_STRER